MDAQLLVNLNAGDLTDYLWKRLRRERPLDPPLAIRFGPEAPAHFLLKVEAETDDRSFHARLMQAVGPRIDSDPDPFYKSSRRTR